MNLEAIFRRRYRIYRAITEIEIRNKIIDLLKKEANFELHDTRLLNEIRECKEYNEDDYRQEKVDRKQNHKFRSLADNDSRTAKSTDGKIRKRI